MIEVWRWRHKKGNFIFCLLMLFFSAYIALAFPAFSHVIHVVGLVAILLGTLLLLLFRWAGLAWIGYGLALWIPFLSMYWPFPTQSIAAGCNITLATFNAKLTRGMTEREVFNVIQTIPADIFFLQEVARPDDLLKFVKSDVRLKSFMPISSDAFGLMLLSRFPLKNELKSTELLVATARIAGVEVRLLTSVNDRIQFASSDPTAQQMKIAEFLADPLRPTIYGGDMNAGPASPKMRILLSQSYDVFAHAGFGMGSTFPARERALGLLGPFMRIDYLLTSWSFAPLSARVGSDNGRSTHYPVQGEVAFSGRGEPGKPCT